jgi:hypothetical protein
MMSRLMIAGSGPGSARVGEHRPGIGRGGQGSARVDEHRQGLASIGKGWQASARVRWRRARWLPRWPKSGVPLQYCLQDPQYLVPYIHNTYLGFDMLSTCSYQGLSLRRLRAHVLETSAGVIIFLHRTCSHLTFQIRWADSDIKIQYSLVSQTSFSCFLCWNFRAALARTTPKVGFGQLIRKNLLL